MKILGLATFCGVLLAPTPTTRSSDVEAVMRYWNSISDHGPAESAALAGIDLLTQDDLKAVAGSHRIYVLSRSGYADEQREVVAVSDEGTVFAVSTRAGFNTMLVAERTRTDSASDADSLARIFLRLSNCGLKAVNLFVLLESIDEIEFGNPDEGRARLVAIGVGPPSVAEIDGGYRFTAYSWSNLGAVSRVDVDMARGFSEILDVRYSLVARKVGNYQSY